MIWVSAAHCILSNFAQKFHYMLKKISIPVIALIALSLWSCRHNQDSISDKRPGVFTFTPEANVSAVFTTHPSLVEEGKSVNIGFKTGGQIKRLTTHEGGYVKKGQVIGYLDDTDYQLSVSQIETQYNQLTSEMKRIEEMYRHHNISENDYEKATAGIEQLKIQLNMAKNNLSYTHLTSPISGYIVEKFMEEGEMVGAGTPVYKVVDNSSVEAVVALPAAAYTNRDKIIKCVGRTTATENEEIPLDIIGFIPDGDNNSLFKLRLRIPDSQQTIIPGMSMTVDIFYNQEINDELKRVPSRALFEKNGKTYVWEINHSDSTLNAKEVKVVGIPEGKYSLVSGLSDNSEIVSVGVHHLSDHQKVKVLGKDEDIKHAAL